MPYCPNCGNPVEQLPDAIAVAETVPADVQIARIQADRDIELARIGRSTEAAWNETRLAETQIEASAEMVTAAARRDHQRPRSRSRGGG